MDHSAIHQKSMPDMKYEGGYQSNSAMIGVWSLGRSASRGSFTPRRHADAIRQCHSERSEESRHCQPSSFCHCERSEAISTSQFDIPCSIFDIHHPSSALCPPSSVVLRPSSLVPRPGWQPQAQLGDDSAGLRAGHRIVSAQFRPLTRKSHHIQAIFNYKLL